MRKDVLAYPLVIANRCCVRMVLEVDDGIFSFLAEPLQLVWKDGLLSSRGGEGEAQRHDIHGPQSTINEYN